MPKLLLFVPCQKVIVDEREHSASLISVMEQLTVNVTSPVPANAQIPFNWTIVTLWTKTPDDEEKTFEQRTEVILPDGSTFLSAVVSFNLSKQSHRNIVDIFGYPISQEGQHIIRLYIRESGKSKEWNFQAEYPVKLIHNTQVPN
jgi:hypothetical protein